MGEKDKFERIEQVLMICNGKDCKKRGAKELRKAARKAGVPLGVATTVAVAAGGGAAAAPVPALAGAAAEFRDLAWLIKFWAVSKGPNTDRIPGRGRPDHGTSKTPSFPIGFQGFWRRTSETLENLWKLGVLEVP